MRFEKKHIILMLLPGLILFSSLSLAVQDPLELGPSAEKYTDNDAIKFGENAPIEDQVDQILSQMTLEEKAGQMVFASFNSYDNKPPQIVKEWIREDKVGFLRLREAPGPKETAQLLNQVQKWSMNSDPPIPIIIYMDSIHGVSYVRGTTIYPHGIGLAATENLELIKELGEIHAEESRAIGVHESASPTADVATEPRWGRVQATYGENYKFVSKAVAGTVQSFQGDEINENSVLAVTKHFPGAGPERQGEDWGDDLWSTIVSDENTLENIHLKPFEAAIEKDTASIMPYYSNPKTFGTQKSIFGKEIPDKITTQFHLEWAWFSSPSIPLGTLGSDVPSMGSEKVVSYLKENMGYEGIVTSDWFPIMTIMSYGYGYKESYEMVLDSGTDVFGRVMFNTFEEQLGKNLPVLSTQDQIVELVKSGKVSENRIDNSVRKIVKTKLKLGLFQDPYVDPEEAEEIAGNENHQETNLEAAEQSLTLLKNENVLPLSENIDSILVAGPRSDSMRSLLGGWSVGGNIVGGGSSENLSGKTIVEAIEDRASEETEIRHVETDSERAEKLAKESDIAILSLGEWAYIHSPPWGPHKLSPTKEQRQLVKAVNKHTPTIVTLSMGRPYVISELKEEVQGILALYYPGNMGGEAVANVMFGNYNPTGSLPFRMPSSMEAVRNQEEDIPFDIENYTYKEGYGLSYPHVYDVKAEPYHSEDSKILELESDYDFTSYGSGYLRVRWKGENTEWQVTEWKDKQDNGTFKENILLSEYNPNLVYQFQLKIKTREGSGYENRIINSEKFSFAISDNL